MAYVASWSAAQRWAAATENGTDPLLQSTAEAHHTHFAAVILDAAVERIALSSYPTQVREEWWFKNLKRDIIDGTFLPLTRCTLARRSAMPPGKRRRTGGIWPTSIQSILQCVAAYHKAANATEHGKCDEIADSIGGYAYTLCIRTDDPDQLVKLLHQWIENRSINMALKFAIDNCLANLSFWKCLNMEERDRAVHLVETAMEIVEINGVELRRRVENLRDTQTQE